MERNPGEAGQIEIHNLRAENRRLQQRFLLLSEVARQISSNLDYSTVLQKIVDGACQLTGAKYGALGLFDASGNIQEFITHGISQEEQARIGDLPRGLGLLGWLQELQQPFRLADLTRHSRAVGFPAHHPPMKTFHGAPVRFADEGLGNIYLTEKADDQEFTPEDENLLVLFAAQAALAIRNARSYQAARTAEEAAEEERRRLLALVDTSPVGIFFVNASGEVILVNREAQRILGFASGHEERLAWYEQNLVYRTDPTAPPTSLRSCPWSGPSPPARRWWPRRYGSSSRRDTRS